MNTSYSDRSYATRETGGSETLTSGPHSARSMRKRKLHFVRGRAVLTASYLERTRTGDCSLERATTSG